MCDNVKVHDLMDYTPSLVYADAEDNCEDDIYDGLLSFLQLFLSLLTGTLLLYLFFLFIAGGGDELPDA